MLPRVVSLPSIISFFLLSGDFCSGEHSGERKKGRGGLLLNTDQFLCPQAVPERERGVERRTFHFPPHPLWRQGVTMSIKILQNETQKEAEPFF